MLGLTLTATDALGTTQSVAASVQVVDKLSILTTTLRSARNGKRFAAVLETNGGGTPVSLRLLGPLPKGLQFARRRASYAVSRRFRLASRS